MKKFWAYFSSALIIISCLSLYSCGDDNDEPEPVTPPTTETVVVTAQPIDIVAIADCGGFKIKFTDNVAYFYMIMLSEDVAKTVTDAQLEEALSNKDLSKRRLPDSKTIYSIEPTTYDQNYIIYTKAYTSDGIGGEIVATPYSTPSWHENEASVQLSYTPNTITFLPDEFTSCYFVRVFTIDEYAGKSKAELIWTFYQEILEKPSQYRRLGESDMNTNEMTYDQSPIIQILVWPQGLDGKLVPWVWVNEFDLYSKQFLGAF